MSSFLSRCARVSRAWALSLLALLAAPAQAGLVQWSPYANLDDIFAQPAILAANGGRGIEIVTAAERSLDMPSTALGPMGEGFGQLTLASGLSASLDIPVFYVDALVGTNTVGLGWVNDNGVARLTSMQEALVERPAGREYVPCWWNPALTCYINIPAVTAADIERGLWRSAVIPAHERARNFGLGYTSEQGLMFPSMPSLELADSLVS